MRKQAFTLIELIGAIIIILILTAIILVVNGTARQRTLETRVQNDIESINTAKHLWSVDHPGQAAVFNAESESAKYTSLQSYLDPQQAATTLSAFAPSGEAYTINNLGSSATSSP